MLEQTLIEIGLTKYEAKIYLALLELGESTSGQILSKANLHTGKIYDILESLKNKGFVSEIIKNKVKHFSPSDPQRVHDFLLEKKKNIEEKEKTFNNLLPDILKRIRLKRKRTHIEIYTGFEGLKTAYLKEFDRYKKGIDVTVFGIQDAGAYEKRIVDFFNNKIYPERRRRKVKVRKIKDEVYKGKGIRSHEKNAKIRYLPYLSIPAISVCEDLTIISILVSDPLAIVIEDKEISDGFKKQFGFFWRIAKS